MTSPAHTHDLSPVLKWLPTGQGIEHTHAGERHRLLSASQDEHALQHTMDLGAVDVVGKPVDLQRLELVVQVGLAVSID